MDALPARTTVTEPATMPDVGGPWVAALMPAYNPGKAINRAVAVVLVDRHLSGKSLSLSRRRRQLWDRLRIQLRYFNAAGADSWLGAIKTVLLFVVPIGLLMEIKGYNPLAVA